MARSVIDPVTRIEGHLRVEMEVENGVVSDAWVSGGCFRGMELVVKDRTPEDAAHIVQRICGVCPVSHSHAATIAAEKAYGITISNNARIIRNLIEGAQFLHSHILWFYTLAALDYVNPLNALKANVGSAYDLVEAAGTSCQSDLKALQERLTKFAENGQLSIFSGNWWKNGQSDTEFKLPAELDLIATAHYIEALTMQSKASEVCALLGGKMPHVMTIVPGGTSFVPTEEKLDDLFIVLIFQRTSANLQRKSKSIWIGAKIVFQSPFCSVGLGDNLAGAKRIDTPSYIQHPTEGIEAPSGALGVFSDCFIVAFNVGIQFVESGIFQFLSYILSVQEDAALDQLCHAEAVKRITICNSFSACTPINNSVGFL